MSAPFKHTMSLEVDVDGFWPDYLTKHSDVFSHSACGYWARGIEHDDERGWLVYEQADDPRPSDEETARVVLLWEQGAELPPRWFPLNRQAALRAWEEGVKRWGVDWYDQTDGPREDVVVQMALLGEVRYG